MMFFDRAKVLVGIATLFGFCIAKYHAELPIISWGLALTNQLSAKTWLLWLAGIELIRQVHYLISERNVGWHQFWTARVFGGWDRFWGRRNPWFRFRMARLIKRLIFVFIAIIVLAAIWGKDPFETAVEAPLRIYNILFGPERGLPFIVSIAMMLLLSVGQFAAIFWFMSRGGVETYLPDEVDTRFSDVWGQDKVLEKVRENIVFLDKPEEIEARGGHVPSGILLYGPPGTGKTLIAKAVAGETGRPYVFVDPGAFQNMFFGVGILKVKALFRKLRKLALRHGGVIVFFDEADSLGNRGVAVQGRVESYEHPFSCNGMSYLSEGTAALVAREHALVHRAEVGVAPPPNGIRQIVATGLGGGGGGMGTLQALLTEISGLDKPRGFLSRRTRSFLTMPAKKPPKYRILIMMATNTPDVLDPALLRPGRIDRKYKVDYPTLEGRKRTFEGYLQRITHSLTAENIERLALMSPNATGASIQDTVNEAVIVALRDGRDIVEWMDVLRAKSLKQYGMPDDVHPMALERHAVAIHEAGHAVAFYRLARRRTIDIATIEPRGAVGGFVAPVPLEEPGFPWRVESENEVRISLASLAAERHFYAGDNSVGVGGDLRSATAVVKMMEGGAAMGATISSLYGTGLFELGDGTKGDHDRSVEARLQSLFAETDAMIRENERYVMAIAHALERYHTVTGEDVNAIFAGTKGSNVDGEWYQSPEFEYAYRRFHEAALKAHQEQGKLEAPLPLPGSLVMVDQSGAIQPWKAPVA